MKANHSLGVSKSGVGRFARNGRAAGFTIIEILVVIVIALVISGIALPIITTSFNNMHLSSAASSLSGAIQAARYQAISIGCPFQFTVTAATNSYQLSTEVVSGTPPACASTYTNVGSAVPFANSDVTISSTTSCPNTPFLLNPSGTVSAVATPTAASSFCIVLAHGATTKTVTVTGVGNVKVTSP